MWPAQYPSEVSVIQISVTSKKTLSPATVLLSWEKETSFLNAPGRAGDTLHKALREEGFEGKPAQAAASVSTGKTLSSRVVALGLGAKTSVTPEVLRRAGGRLARKAREIRLEEASLVWPRSLTPEQAKAFTEGLLLGSYQFNRYKTQLKDNPKGITRFAFQTHPEAAAGVKKAVQTAEAYCSGVVLARDLINGAPSDVTPKVLADTARKIAKGPVKARVYGKSELKRMGAGGLLGVNIGSAQEPYLIHLHYKPKGVSRKSVAIVGKGITFDSGGLSLKPAGSMETMKMDMSGAAAVLGVFSQLAVLKPPVEVHGIIATTENMPGGRAYKPGDVLKAMNGKTMEVLNTDAEGRLILADALSYAVRQKPDAMIDMATLTGACIIALGWLVTGAMTNNPKLLEDLKEASEAEGERLWELPLVDEYRNDIKSRVADIKNIGGGRDAGSIIGGLFLQEFVGETPWVHLDIAGPAYPEKDYSGIPYQFSFSGAGLMVRTLLTFLKNA